VSRKQRLSASVDSELVDSGQQIVAAGRASSLSAWVNAALRAEVERDRRLQALGDFVATFEAEHGEITEAEVLVAGRAARERAIVGAGPRADPRRRCR
jgi:hypothetical protein